MDQDLQNRQIEQIKRWLQNGSVNIFGLPFAGKDTQGRELARLLGAELVGGGEIIRSDVTPQHMKDHIAAGKLTPTDEYLALILPYLSQSKFNNHPLIFSSVGRWFGEHTHVQKAASDAGHPIKAVLYIEIAVDELRKRWEASLTSGDRGQRHDDAQHVLETRIQEFEEKTLPVIEYYKNEDLLITISSSGTQAETLSLILEKLCSYSELHP